MKDNPEIIELKPKKAVPIAIIEQILEMAKDGELDSLVLAGRNKDGDIITSVINADMIEEQTLISYMQTRLTTKVVISQMNNA